MTRKELSQLYYLNREIEQDKQRLAKLESLSADIEMGILGLPFFIDFDDTKELQAEITDIRNIIAAKTNLCIAEYNRLMRYITTVDDSYIRQILTFRYIDGFSWVQVAMHIGGGNTEDSVRMAHNRFFQK